MKFPNYRHLSAKQLSAFLRFFLPSGKEIVLLKDYLLTWWKLTQIFKRMNQLTLFTPLAKMQQKVSFSSLLPHQFSISLIPSICRMKPGRKEWPPTLVGATGKMRWGRFRSIYRREKRLRPASEETDIGWKGKCVFHPQTPGSNLKLLGEITFHALGGGRTAG